MMGNDRIRWWRCADHRLMATIPAGYNSRVGHARRSRAPVTRVGHASRSGTSSIPQPLQIVFVQTVMMPQFVEDGNPDLPPKFLCL